MKVRVICQDARRAPGLAAMLDQDPFGRVEVTMQPLAPAGLAAAQCDVVLIDIEDRTGLEGALDPVEAGQAPPIVIIARSGVGLTPESARRRGVVDVLDRDDASASLVCRAVRLAAEQRQADRDHRIQEARYRELIEANYDGMLVLDDQGDILYANPAAERLLQRSASSLVGVPFGQPIARDGAVELQIRRTNGEPGTAEMRAVGTEWQGKPAFVASLRDITDHKIVQQRLIDYQRDLRDLAAQVLRVEHAERRRIATGLHDGPTQLLVAAKMQLEAIRENPTQLDRLERIAPLLEEAISSIRNMVFELTPPELYISGLVTALQQLSRRLSDQYDFELDVREISSECPLLNDEIANLLFQASRELVLNAVKHSGVKQATIWLRSVDDHLRVAVVDDGCGFSSADEIGRSRVGDGYGLFNIRERIEQIGGELNVESRAGDGTCATLIVPLNADTLSDPSRRDRDQHKSDDDGDARDVLPSDVARAWASDRTGS